MFTGIVEATGRIRDVEDLDTTRRLRVEVPAIASELSPGDSVAVDGACLTVADVDGEGFSVDVIATTLERTVAGTYEAGSVVNLERALLAGARLDGHLVQGHIDGIGHLVQCTMEGDTWLMDFRLPVDVAALTVERGSVTINGVSLTVSSMPEVHQCRIGLIPYTREHTNLGGLAVGGAVNVEGDLIGKYVGKVLAQRVEEGRNQ